MNDQTMTIQTEAGLVTIRANHFGVAIAIQGHTAQDDDEIIWLDCSEQDPFLAVWASKAQADYTHGIDFGRARV